MRFIVTLLAVSLVLIFSLTAFSTESSRSNSLDVSKPAIPSTAPATTSIAATQISSGLIVSTFQTAQGTLRLYLPGDETAGDFISGIITAQPAGSTKAEKEENLDRIAAFTLVAAGKSVPVIDGRVKWQIPAESNTLSIILVNKEGKEIGRSDLALQSTRSERKQAFQLAGVAQVGRPIQISGPFDGDLDNTHIEVNGEPINVIAESPREIVIAAPADRSGLVDLILKQKAMSVHCTYQAVSITLSAPKTSLTSGEQTTVTIAINGLSKMSTKFALELTNESPGVVNMEGGSVQNIDISPEQIPADGIYKTTRALIGLGDGSFQLAARLLDQSSVMSCETASVLSTSPR